MVLFLVVLGLAGLVLWLYCLFDLIITPRDEIRTLPKLGWIPIVVLFFVFGAAAWLLVGRPRTDTVGSARLVHPSYGQPTTESDSPRRGRRPPLGPDDDPEFLRRLGDDESDDD